MTSIFLSYARGDDEAFVRRLYADLNKAGFDVWFDRVSMPSRQLTFHQEIRDAIAACDRLLLVVGPGVITSDYITQEWRFAYFEAGKCVNPIVRLDARRADGSTVDGYKLIPKDLQFLHAEDFRNDAQYDQHLKKLSRQLSEAIPPVGKLVAVPELPTCFLEQRGRINALRDLLLIDLQNPVVVSGAAARVGLQGMGGIGKSVLASAVAHRPEVRRAFPDGIFWITLGQKPQLAELQRWLARELGGEALSPDERSGKECLRTLLAGRKALLVLDDVWRREHAEAFNVTGAMGRILLTTRDAGLVTALASMGTHYRVELPSEAEAETIFAASAHLKMEGLPPATKEIIAQCGRLPLALALCGGMVRGGVSSQDLLEALRDHDLEYLSTDHPAEEHHRNAWRAMDVSLRVLPPEQRDRFAELAVFALDRGAPEAAVITLWEHTGGLSPRHARKLLADFAARSLLQLSSAPGSIGQPLAWMNLHDLLHNFAEGMAEKQFGSLAALHRRLLDAYRAKCPSAWDTGPNDGYFLGHLRDHLVAAGKVEELVAIAVSLRWLETKANAGMVFDLRLDLDAAVQALPTNEPRRRLLRLIEQALSSEITFIARHPTTLFQCLWNLCWWYDCSEAAKHYDATDGPWNATGEKLSHLLQTWRLQKETTQPAFAWVRSLLPPRVPLGEGQIWSFQHDESVRCVTCSSDGRLVASGDQANWPRENITPTVCLWDLRTGALQNTLRGHEGRISALAFTVDAARLASGATAGDVRVWDTHSGLLLWKVDQIAPYYDGGIRYDGNGKRVQEWAAVSAIAFSPDTEIMAVAMANGVVQLLRPTDGERLRAFKHRSEVTSIAFSPDHNRLISACLNGDLLVWDTNNGTVLNSLQHEPSWILSVVCSPKGDVFASGSITGLITLWDLRTLQPRLKLHCEKSSDEDFLFSTTRFGGLLHGGFALLSLAFSSDGARLFSGGVELRSWDSKKSTLLGVFRDHDEAITGVAYSRLLDAVITSSLDRRVRVRQSAGFTGSPVAVYGDVRVRNAWFDKSGARVASSPLNTGTMIQFACEISPTTNEWSLVPIRDKEDTSDVASSRSSPSQIGVRAVNVGVESRLETTSDRQSIAWFPLGLQRLRQHPTAYLWVGVRNSRLFAFALEGGIVPRIDFPAVHVANVQQSGVNSRRASWMWCQNCGSLVNDSHRTICIHCDARCGPTNETGWECATCGLPIPPSWAYCIYCGFQQTYWI